MGIKGYKECLATSSRFWVVGSDHKGKIHISQYRGGLGKKASKETS